MIPFPEIEKIAEPQTPATAGQAVSWWWWAGAVVLGLIVLALLIWGLRVFFLRISMPAAPARPEKVALRELRALRKRADSLSPREVGCQLADLIRAFLHRRTGLLAKFATTEELTGRSRRPDQAPPPPLAAAFAAVLDGCDALKFGASSVDARVQLLAAAEAALREVSAAVKHPAPTAVVPGPPNPPTPATTEMHAPPA